LAWLIGDRRRTAPLNSRRRPSEAETGL
jgi:hypothetical protein